MKDIQLQNSVRLFVHLGIKDLIMVEYRQTEIAPKLDASSIIKGYLKRECIDWIVDDFVPVTFYRAPEDSITVPENSMYNDDHILYDQFQAMINSTGHPDRLNRFGQLDSIYSNDKYSEELVAQLGAMILCTLTGQIPPFPLRVDSKDSRIKGKAAEFIMKAADDAEKAVEFILEGGSS